MDQFIQRYGANVATTLLMTAVVSGSTVCCALGLILLGFPIGGKVWNFAVPAALIIPFFVGTPLVHNLIKSNIKLLRVQKQLEELANKDALTGLYNRQYFFDHANEWDKRCRENSGHFSLLMLDVDHFKSINDRFGHPVGDRVLQRVSNVIKGFMRQEDMCARYGGEEFICLLPDTNAAGAKAVAERIRLGMEHQAFLKARGLSLSVSIGATTMSANDNLETLIERADQALYEAKDGGRNRAVFKAADDTEPSKNHLAATAR
ncbi:response regulator PleD [gamma proteobacterium HTCC5015]|nr:response regulator PleD [gamma proteobacterium HTCC5015]